MLFLSILVRNDCYRVRVSTQYGFYKPICVSVPDSKNFKKDFSSKMMLSTERPSHNVNKNPWMPPGVSSTWEQMPKTSQLKIQIHASNSTLLLKKVIYQIGKGYVRTRMII